MKNLTGLMKQAQEIQAKLQSAQEELEALEVEGKAGGGLVTVKMTGKGAVIGLSIDESLVKPEEREILEDLIIAAINDAKSRAEQAAQEKMQSVTGGLPLPPGFSL